MQDTFAGAATMRIPDTRSSTESNIEDSHATLASDHFLVEIDPQNASIQTLQNPSDPFQTNFVLDASQAPEFDIEDSRFLGDLVFHVRRVSNEAGTTMTSGCSKDIRSISKSADRVVVTYKGDASNAGGFRDFSVVESYILSGTSRSALDWTIEVRNETSETLVFEDFGFPALMNSCWGNSQTKNYEQGVHRHSFVAKHGSYIYWQRPNGEGPMLIMTTHRNTSLEFKHRFREGENVFGENLPRWEGLVEYYIHSKHISQARADMAGTYLPATSLTLRPGKSQQYGFRFSWADDSTGLRQAIYTAGGLDVISMPGMVIPTDTTVTLALRCTDQIASVNGSPGSDSVITPSRTANGYHIYDVNFKTLGANHITVLFDDSRSTVLQYYCIEPIKILIEKRATFLSKHQQAKTSRGYDGAFLQWDMTAQKLITWDDYPGGGWKEWMAGGSDDLGLAPAAFLSEKCLTLPEQSEVSSIDYYIERFLFGYLLGAQDSTGKRTFQVYRWYDGQDGAPQDASIWRAYNYTHIANTFFNMYRIRKAYAQLQMRYQCLEYLVFAFEVLNAMYDKIPVPNPIGDAANELGLMGESTVPEIIRALELEGLSSEKEKLLGFVERKLKHYQHVKYPFASEQTIDTTGFESVYALSKAFGTRDLIDKSQKASLASRGLQPLWYFYGSDNRLMGESYWNLGYETQLGAWQQLDYLINFSTQDKHDFADMIRSSWGAYLAGWANINSGQIDPNCANIGAAAWLWQSEGGKAAWSYMSLVGNWWAWSGEADLGLWGALRAASVFIVEDPVVGLYAYGGEVVHREDKYLIRPLDGVRRRFTLFNINNLTVEISQGQFSLATVGQAGDFLEIDIQAVCSMDCKLTIAVKNLPTGNYEASHNGNLVKQRCRLATGLAMEFNWNETPNRHSKVIIQRTQDEKAG